MAEHASTWSSIGGGPGGYVAAIRGGPARHEDRARRARASGRHLPQLGLHPDQGAAALGRDVRSPAAPPRATSASAAKEVGFDFAKVIERSRKVAGQLIGGVAASAEEEQGRRSSTGRAGSTARAGVAVEQGRQAAHRASRRQARHPGDRRARARSLPGLEPDGKLIWTYKEAMVPDAMPKSLLVIGSGAIGIEFASFYRHMGAEVTVVEVLDRVLPVEDEEISALRPQAVREARHEDPHRRQGERAERRQRQRHGDARGGRQDRARSTVERVIAGGRHRRQRREPRPRGDQA